ANADVLLLLEVYPAGEKAIAGADGRSLCGSIRQRGKLDPVFIGRDDSLEAPLKTLLQPGDLLLMQGAGDVGALAQNMAQQLPQWLKEVQVRVWRHWEKSLSLWVAIQPSGKYRCAVVRLCCRRCSRCRRMCSLLIFRTTQLTSSPMPNLMWHLLPCTAVVVKTAHCRGCWNGWINPIPAAVLWLPLWRWISGAPN